MLQQLRRFTRDARHRDGTPRTPQPPSTRVGMVLLGLCLAAPWALAGIPEPGLIVAGQVWESGDTMLTGGELVFTFTPDGGGSPVTASTRLRSIDTPIGEFSFSLMIPAETAVPGYPVSEGALDLDASPAAYSWNAMVTATGISDSGSVNISTADLGTAICSPPPQATTTIATCGGPTAMASTSANKGAPPTPATGMEARTGRYPSPNSCA